MCISLFLFVMQVVTYRDIWLTAMGDKVLFKRYSHSSWYIVFCCDIFTHIFQGCFTGIDASEATLKDMGNRIT